MRENKLKVVMKANELTGQLSKWRRHLHRNPELSFQEFQTATYITEQLSRIEGIKIQTGVANTGVVGTITNGEGPTIAIRADIDALPIQEENISDYCSTNKGVMHACGHDAHPAIVLATALLIANTFKEENLNGTVKFIFQPAEECTDEYGLSGAPYMIQEGVLQGVDAILALHMCPWLPVGSVQLHDGYSMANVDVFEGKLFGTGGHGAYPHLGTDPIWMLGPVMQALHGIVARKVSPLEPAVVSIGQIHAGTASNIIPTEVAIEGTIRSYSEEVRKLVEDELEKAFSIVRNLGGNYQLRIENGEPALRNNPTINCWISKTINDIYPNLQVHNAPFGLGGEDFGYMTREIPGSMFFLGCAFPNDVTRDLHTPTFDIDEGCLSIGTAILTNTIISYLKGEFTIRD
ncbi:M20 metallopeptidase family protein [Halalkalibacter lacteus]|uniref:M20 metallopeptidase family protein n=1 Tax=Halalkalibacter lacteus TaxID=3090663 RepID=UPI002FC7DBD5